MAATDAQAATRAASEIGASRPPVIEKHGSGFNAAAHGLRGIASVIVMAAHILGGTARHVYQHHAGYVSAIEHPWYLGTFGVEIFFVISGYVILPSALKYSLGEFALRRFVRIYPLFFTLSILFVLMNANTNAYAPLNNARSIVAGLLFMNLFTGTEQLTPNAWSLSFEIAFYVLAAVVVAFAVRRRSPLGGTLAIMAAVAFLLAFPISIFFLIGVAMRLLVPTDLPATRMSRTIEAVALVLLLWFASRGHFDYTHWSQFSGPVVPPLLVTISAYFYLALMPSSLTARALDRRVFRYIGDVSYSLYLVHPFTYFGLRAIFVRLGWFTDNVALSMLLFGACVFASSFLVTHFVHAWLERWPYQAIFHQKVYHAKAGTEPC